MRRASVTSTPRPTLHAAVACRVDVGDAHQIERDAERGAICGAVALQQLHDAGADRAEADQPDAHGSLAHATHPCAAARVSARGDCLACGARAGGQRAADAAHGLAGAVLVLDQREAHVVVAVLAEADARRNRDLAPRAAGTSRTRASPSP